MNLLKYLASLVLIGLLVFAADWHQLADSLARLSSISVSALVLLAVLLIWLSVLKWGILLRSFGARVRSWELAKLYIIGYFVNSFLPSSLGGDMTRSYVVGRTVGQAEAAAATLLDRYTGLVAMVTLALVMMWRGELTPWPIRSFILLLALGVMVITLAALSSRTETWMKSVGIPERWLKGLVKVQHGLKLAVDRPRLLLHSMLWSYAFHGAAVFNTLVTARAIGWESSSPFELFCVVPLILIAGNIPVTPSNLGIQEGAFFFFLTAIGATPAQALGVAVVLRAKSLLLAILGGFFWLGIRKQLPPFLPQKREFLRTK